MVVAQEIAQKPKYYKDKILKHDVILNITLFLFIFIAVIFLMMFLYVCIFYDIKNVDTIFKNTKNNYNVAYKSLMNSNMVLLKLKQLRAPTTSVFKKYTSKRKKMIVKDTVYRNFLKLLESVYDKYSLNVEDLGMGEKYKLHITNICHHMVLFGHDTTLQLLEIPTKIYNIVDTGLAIQLQQIYMHNFNTQTIDYTIWTAVTTFRNKILQRLSIYEIVPEIRYIINNLLTSAHNFDKCTAYYAVPDLNIAAQLPTNKIKTPFTSQQLQSITPSNLLLITNLIYNITLNSIVIHHMESLLKQQNNEEIKHILIIFYIDYFYIFHYMKTLNILSHI